MNNNIFTVILSAAMNVQNLYWEAVAHLVVFIIVRRKRKSHWLQRYYNQFLIAFYAGAHFFFLFFSFFLARLSEGGWACRLMYLSE